MSRASGTPPAGTPASGSRARIVDSNIMRDIKDDCFGYLSCNGPHVCTIFSATLICFPRYATIFSTIPTAPVNCGNFVRVKSLSCRKLSTGSIRKRTPLPLALHSAPVKSFKAVPSGMRPLVALEISSLIVVCTFSAVRHVSGLLIGPRTRFFLGGFVAKRSGPAFTTEGRCGDKISLTADIAAPVRFLNPNKLATKRTNEFSTDVFLAGYGIALSLFWKLGLVIISATNSEMLVNP